MPSSPQDKSQAELWNGRSGQTWTENRELLDQLFAPFKALLVEAVTNRSARAVLDVGCGTGATTAAIADSLAAVGGSCTGVDISAQMITDARERNTSRTNARFICADAEDYPFPPGSFDTIVSRFGVMFFRDPTAAFGNLRRAATEDAELGLIVWRAAADNDFMTTAVRAAGELLPAMPQPTPGAPGQFGFADPNLVTDILRSSGWRSVDVRPLDVQCSFPESALHTYVTRLGPVGAMLAQVDASTREQLIRVVVPAFAPFVDGSTVRFTAACWWISATAA